MLSQTIQNEVSLAIKAEQQGIASPAQKALVQLHTLFQENELTLCKTLKQSFMLGSATSALGQMAKVELSSMEVAPVDKEGQPKLDEMSDVQAILDDIISMTAPSQSTCH